MPKQGGDESGRPWPERGSTRPVPDLTGVDLHGLRTLDSPELRAAVDDVLRFPQWLSETWQGDTKDG